MIPETLTPDSPEAILRSVRRTVIRTQRIGTTGITDAAKLRDFWRQRSIERKWYRQLFASPVLLTIAAAANSVDTAAIHALPVDAVGILAWRMNELRTMPGTADLKTMAAEEIEWRSHVEIAVNVLLVYAKQLAPVEDVPTITRIAKDIEQLGFVVTPHAQELPADLDYRMVGQKGGQRAFAIRTIDSHVPQLPNRYSVIADLACLVGVNASPQLVRATLLRGKT
jgi:hypothetical protein